MALPETEIKPPEAAPALEWKLWIYTNYDCNLRCSYCVAKSSPNAPRRAIGLANVQRLVDEAVDLGFTDVFFTGGEPFILNDIYDMLVYASARLKTTVLTNAMILRGPRLEKLVAIANDRLIVQVSLDGGRPEHHDAYRGVGSWAKTVEGIKKRRCFMTTAEQKRAQAGGSPAVVAPQLAPIGRWDQRLQRSVIVLGRLGLGVLFLTQLSWKLPPTFGCGPDYAFTTADANGNLHRTQGLCDWIGLESVYATRDRPVLGVNIRPLAQLNGAFIDGFVKPNIRWFGYVIFFSETFITITMLLGLTSRLGALVAIGMSTQLLVGLANIPDPYEWEWSYLLMVILAIMMFGLAPGRIFGLDALLRPRLAAAAARGSRAARFGLLLT